MTPRIRFHTQVVEVQQRGPAEWLVKSRECADGKPLCVALVESVFCVRVVCVRVCVWCMCVWFHCDCVV